MGNSFQKQITNLTQNASLNGHIIFMTTLGQPTLPYIIHDLFFIGRWGKHILALSSTYPSKPVTQTFCPPANRQANLP